MQSRPADEWRVSESLQMTITAQRVQRRSGRSEIVSTSNLWCRKEGGKKKLSQTHSTQYDGCGFIELGWQDKYARSGSKLDPFKRALDIKTLGLDKSLYGSLRKHHSDPMVASKLLFSGYRANIEHWLWHFDLFSFLCLISQKTCFCPEFSAVLLLF